MDKYSRFTKSRKFNQYALPLVLLITALVFLNSLFNGFTNWDDNTYVLNNQFIKDFSWEGAKTIMFSYTGLGGTRLTLLNFMLDFHFFKTNPFPYHLANLLLHLCNVTLLYFFVKRLFLKADVAAITALLFAIHPMHIESVVWVSERKDVLYTFFFLLSLLSYQVYILNSRKYLYLILAFLFFFLSWHSKLSAACLPVVLLLMDYYYKRRITWKLVLEKLPFFLFVIVLTSKIFLFHQTSGGDFHQITQKFSFLDRFLMAGYSVGFYLLKFIAPFKLNAIHPYPQKIDGALPLVYYFATTAMLLLAALSVWAVIHFKTIRRELIFGILFFLGTIAMFVHFIPIKGVVVVADRYTYIPYIGVFALVGFLVNRFLTSNHSSAGLKKLVLSVLAVFVLMFAGLAINRNFVWKDSLTLFSDVISKNPTVEYAFNNRGIVRKEVGDLEGAIADFDESIRLNPAFPYSYSNRGIAKSLLKDYAGAIEDLNMAIAIKGDYFEAYFNRAIVKKNLKDFDGMLQDLNLTIQFKKGFAPAYYERALERYRRKELQEALADINLALKNKPLFPEASYLRGNIYKDRGEYEVAIADYTASITIAPDNAEAFNNRGFAKNSTGDFAGALEDLTRAIELNKNLAEAYNNKGIALANLQRINESIPAFDAAIKLKPDYAEAYNNRGNAKAYSEDFEGSLKDFNIVLQLNPRDSVAFVNRGNVKYSLNDTKGACLDWNRAFEMGFMNAGPLIQQYCK